MNNDSYSWRNFIFVCNSIKHSSNMWITVRRTDNGGRFKTFPKKLRVVLVVQLILQIFFVIIILQAGGLIPLWFSDKVTRTVCIVMAAYLSLNAVMNFVSKSKKEKYIMTPLSLLSAICFWITAFRM